MVIGAHGFEHASILLSSLDWHFTTRLHIHHGIINGGLSPYGYHSFPLGGYLRYPFGLSRRL